MSATTNRQAEAESSVYGWVTWGATVAIAAVLLGSCIWLCVNSFRGRTERNDVLFARIQSVAGSVFYGAVIGVLAALLVKAATQWPTMVIAIIALVVAAIALIIASTRTAR